MKLDKRTSIISIVSGIILIALFGFILIFNLGNYLESKSFTDSAEEVTATCTECFTHTEGETEEYFISVEYYLNNQNYTAEDLIVDRKYSAQEGITAYVNKNNPSDIRFSLPESHFNFISLAVMIPFTILGIMLILVGAKTLQDTRKKKK